MSLNYLKVVTRQNALNAPELQGAVIVGFLIGYDPSPTHVKIQKSLAAVVTTTICGFQQRFGRGG